METKELRKERRQLKKIENQINQTINRVNKGIVSEFNDGTKWIEFNSFSIDGSHIIYHLDKYTEYLLDTTIELSSVPTLTLQEFHNKRRNVGVKKEYCVEPKNK